MNRVFKNKWSAAHQQYVVTDEHRSTKGKASKSAVALAVAAVAMMAAGGKLSSVFLTTANALPQMSAVSSSRPSARISF